MRGFCESKARPCYLLALKAWFNHEKRGDNTLKTRTGRTSGHRAAYRHQEILEHKSTALKRPMVFKNVAKAFGAKMKLDIMTIKWISDFRARLRLHLLKL